MQHTKRTYDAILRLFAERQNARLTPSYVAYELDTTTERAEDVLDEMVRQSLLELDFDDNGQLYYSLSDDIPSSLWGTAPRSSSGRSSRHTSGRSSGGSRRYDQPSDPRGFDGSVGHSQSGWEVEESESRQARPSGRSSEPTRGPNGYDGTVTGRAPGWGRSRPPRSFVETREEHSERNRQRPQTAQRQQAPPRYENAEQGQQSGQLVRHRSDELAVRRQADPLIAGLLSVLLVGGGQLYNREVGKGIAMFVAWWFMWSFALGWVVNIWAAVDAYTVAHQRRNDDES